MAWLLRALLLGLSAQQLVIATTASNNDAAQPPAAAGSNEDLAYEQIHKSQIVYTSNSTTSSEWISTNICSQKTYCIYTNPYIGHGRGIVLLTKFADFQKIERLDQHLSLASDRIEPNALLPDGSPPFEESYILSKGPGLTARTELRRGKPLMEAAPVLVVHKDFFADIWRKTERNKMLEKAVSFLPPATKEKFNKQRHITIGSIPDSSRADAEDGQKARTIEEILLASPFEIDLGTNSYTPMGHDPQGDHSKHYINYPSTSLFTHSCRPNLAFHIDGNLALRTTVARKIQPGEELSIAYIDPFKPRKERQEWVGRYRPSPSQTGAGGEEEEGGGCPCPSCTGLYPRITHKQHGHPHTSSPSSELAKSDARLAEIEAIRSELRNHESRGVTPEKIEKFLQLHVEEGLETKMAEAYELAATNYNYMGMDRMAKRYADKAVQAAQIEYGRDANDVIAMRIMAGDVRGHWSFGYKSKDKRGGGGQ
ncbi:hypothetical protein B0T20DRAFT_436663 [Sordaria brevicollis]|uniref:SET domain-containing protein n=1 Tax=Sordaria brevicollis TaxID=83679 RepID=A0AAE0PGE9_SORBR|nr:hypothetical protein B0T20DRAFT_436663 [Sordaria brevicollis]